MTEAILNNDYELTESLLPMVNPNCFHRETQTHTDEGAKTITSWSWLNTPLIAATRQGNLEIAQLLLLQQADVNYRMDDDESLLIVAVQVGNFDFVKLLVENGANTDVTDLEEMTALDYALQHNNQPIIDYLKSKNAKYKKH